MLVIQNMPQTAICRAIVEGFDNITLYFHKTETEIRYEVTPLSPLQRRILKALASQSQSTPHLRLH